MMSTLAMQINWNELFAPPTVFGLGGILLAMIAVIAPQWRRVQQTQTLARLTRDMIERGFTADEIERVLNAGAKVDGRSAERKGHASVMNGRVMRHPEPALVQTTRLKDCLAFQVASRYRGL